MLDGKAEFGVAGSDIITNHASGQKVVALATIFQHSAYTIISPIANNIRFPSDLIGKKIMASQDQGWVQLQALFLKEGITLDSLKIIQHTWNNEDLINGYADAMSGYTSVEPYQLQQKAVQVNQLLPANYGIDFYGDLLFTTKQTIQKHPVLVEKFRRASIRGWEYAMAHPQELAEYILTLPGVKARGVTKDALLYEAKEMSKLILPTLVEMGHQNEGRWQHILNTYKTLGLVNNNSSLEGFIYDPEKNESSRLQRTLLISAGVAMLIIVLFLLYGISLRKAVRNRTIQLQLEVGEHALARDQLEITKERLNMTIKAAGMGIWDWDIEQDLITVSESGAESLGYDSDNFNGDKNFLRSLVHPDDLTALTSSVLAQVETLTEQPSLIVRLKTKTGEWKWHLMSSRVVKRDIMNNAVFISGIFLNVDELKKKELKLSKLSNTLLKRNTELQQYAYITSHNLRSPVANLISLSQLFKKEELNSHNSLYFSKINECIYHLNETINDINEILSLRSVADETKEQINLSNLLTTVTASISEMIKTSGATINTKFEIEELISSKRILQSVFMNLITNAIKYRRADIPLQIQISSADKDDHYSLQFKDNGTGLDLEKYADKVFRLFQRFHSGIEGKGMGLYIIKSQLESLSGSITVESIKNSGTTFTVTLPKTEDQYE